MKAILVDAVNTFVIKGEGIFEEMHRLLEQYPNKKIILTGADDEQFKQFGLDKMPYPIFTLKHDPEKSDPKYYKLMLKHFSLQPKDAVYLEHNEDAIKSAESIGIITHFYDKDKKDLVSLKRFLDKNLS
ncbi:MAG: hypothetical protein V1866_02365 [archaeon]